MKTLYAITLSLLFCWTLNIEEEREVVEKEIEYQILCNCGYRDLIHWKEKPLNRI